MYRPYGVALCTFGCPFRLVGLQKFDAKSESHVGDIQDQADEKEGKERNTQDRVVRTRTRAEAPSTLNLQVPL
jgi:hypothetical protein